MPRHIVTHDHVEQRVRDWVPSPLAPRSGLSLMPTPLTIPNLRTFDSTDSWSPQTKWPSTPVPEDSSSNVPPNSADLITSDDPWYLDATAKLVLEKIPPSIACTQPEFETIYGLLKGCSDTRLPLELFALAVNLMEALGGDAAKGAWVEKWMESRPVHGKVHEQDDCLPEGDPIPSSFGTFLPSYFRPASETPSPPPELFVIAILACSNNLLAASAHPMSQDYDNRNSAHWAILVSRGRFGISQVRVATQTLWRLIRGMAQDQVWGKMHKRMDQIERRAAKTMKEDAEDEDEMWEGGMLGVAGGMQRLGIGTVGSYELAEPRIHYGRYEGTGVDWQADDDSGVNHNKKFGTEETRSVTVSEWLNGII